MFRAAAPPPLAFALTSSVTLFVALSPMFSESSADTGAGAVAQVPATFSPAVTGDGVAQCTQVARQVKRRREVEGCRDEVVTPAARPRVQLDLGYQRATPGPGQAVTAVMGR